MIDIRKVTNSSNPTDARENTIQHHLPLPSYVFKLGACHDIHDGFSEVQFPNGSRIYSPLVLDRDFTVIYSFKFGEVSDC